MEKAYLSYKDKGVQTIEETKMREKLAGGGAVTSALAYTFC